MNSLASSASSGSSSTMLSVSVPNSARGPRRAPRRRAPETICGSANSSVIALPSAIRSGQNATSTSSPRVGEQLLDAPRSRRGRRCCAAPAAGRRGSAAQRCRAPAGTACGSGLRCSSTGVPIDHDHVLGRADVAGSVLAPSDPAASASSSALRGAVLEERQPPDVDPIDGRGVDVVDARRAGPGTRRRWPAAARRDRTADDDTSNSNRSAMCCSLASDSTGTLNLSPARPTR